MNGRLYDPVVGRFLEPDPVVQDASSTQNLNRYSYCLNNPLRYVDPSGYRMLELLQSRGNNFWYRGDYYTQDENGNWTGSFFGDAPGGGSPGGSQSGIGTGNAGPSFQEWQKKKEAESVVWIQLGFFYYDSNGNPLTINGNNGEFWIYEAKNVAGINNVAGKGTGLGGDDLIGPGLILFGSPIVPKSGGIGGGGSSGKWTSPASKLFRTADRIIQNKLKTNFRFAAKGIVNKYLGTRGIGAALGRTVPYVGWGWTAWDVGWYLGENYGPSTWFSPEPPESKAVEYMREHGILDDKY